ncbi:MAG: NRDE family protein [Hydrogenophaga sp.]|jgi:uncharacterized protein with NRDE domain|uniref:NRDE family protein n=1 Tax=Hydrogenophaga sp. TaxID=1904254 RepID=UPI002716653A|nr:NRDE family protein [Hydrogenophaga sp.]MDO9483972.1 NRDE family protein [Hydrogenophaga sp.]MDO9569459.1 NRDE family protein [Hydrogenophaga sp.]MDP2222367.1 NRDE family protein [Hydrogenophaga sp.]MDP3346312.1 NRDE family protein [Hydrogenophaga sp.]MDP3373803.1 NRDE family protein [Hydrogenophaga sp.]
MCLIAFAIDAHAACPLLIAANRDEFLDRPTAGLHRWSLPSGSDVVAGRDLRDGGTWLGVSPNGRVAMLTNVRDAQPGTAQRSRGELPTRWLAGALDGDALQSSIDPGAYGGFNLVVGDFHQRFWAWLGNRDPQNPHQAPSTHTTRLHTQRLGAGIYGLSNATLNTPWPKTQRLTQALGSSLEKLGQAENGTPWWAHLPPALVDEQQAADADLPSTGVALALERHLSSPFVRMPERGYGTRSSLVVRVQPHARTPGRWQVKLDEWTHAHSAAAPNMPKPVGGLQPEHRSETLVW